MTQSAMWESASIYTERKRDRERPRETESDVVLCIDLYVSVRAVIKGEKDKHHSWMFIARHFTQPCWITAELRTHRNVLLQSHCYLTGIFEQVLQGMKSVSVSPQRIFHNIEVRYRVCWTFLVEESDFGCVLRLQLERIFIFFSQLFSHKNAKKYPSKFPKAKIKVVDCPKQSKDTLFIIKKQKHTKKKQTNEKLKAWNWEF